MSDQRILVEENGDGPAVWLAKKKRQKMTTNPDYAHRRMMAAIKAIADGWQLDDVASVPSDYGREFKIRDRADRWRTGISGAI